MAVSRINTRDEENRNCSDSWSDTVPILKEESELFKTRLKEVIGDRTNTWFAKQCGFSDSLLGSYLRGEKSPGLDYLVKIAEVGEVTIDWLATGRPPKTRAEQKSAYKNTPNDPIACQEPAPLINYDALEAIIEGTLKVAPNAKASAQAAHITKVYKQGIDDGLITATGPTEKGLQMNAPREVKKKSSL